MGSRREEYDPVYKMAMDISDQEWIAAGKTQKELDDEREVTDVLDSLLASGKSLDEIDAEWEGKSNAQILEEYAPAAATR